MLSTPGYKFWAPAGTEAPAAVVSVTHSVFAMSWPMSWIPVEPESEDEGILHLMCFQRVTGVEAHTLVGQTAAAWTDLDIPDGMIAAMIGWESDDNKTRIIAQSAIYPDALQFAAKARYAR